jgi:hypothetical protein
MIIASDHATVYAGVVVADPAHQIVLLSMAGPRTAVKAIYAALRSNHHPWLKLYSEGSAKPAAVVRGAERYRVRATPLPSVRGVPMVLVAHAERAPAGAFYALPGEPAGQALVQALDGDSRLVVPVLPGWGDYLLCEAQEAPATFPDECPDAPARLVEPLQVHGELLAEAYVYARDNDGWLALVDRGLQSGQLRWAGSRPYPLLEKLLEAGGGFDHAVRGEGIPPNWMQEAQRWAQ